MTIYGIIQEVTISVNPQYPADSQPKTVALMTDRAERIKTACPTVKVALKNGLPMVILSVDPNWRPLDGQCPIDNQS